MFATYNDNNMHAVHNNQIAQPLPLHYFRFFSISVMSYFAVNYSLVYKQSAYMSADDVDMLYDMIYP